MGSKLVTLYVLLLSGLLVVIAGRDFNPESFFAGMFLSLALWRMEKGSRKNAN